MDTSGNGEGLLPLAAQCISSGVINVDACLLPSRLRLWAVLAEVRACGNAVDGAEAPVAALQPSIDVAEAAVGSCRQQQQPVVVGAAANRWLASYPAIRLSSYPARSQPVRFCTTRASRRPHHPHGDAHSRLPTCGSSCPAPSAVSTSRRGFPFIALPASRASTYHAPATRPSPMSFYCTPPRRVETSSARTPCRWPVAPPAEPSNLRRPASS